MKVFWFVLMIVGLIGVITSTGEQATQFMIITWGCIILLNMPKKEEVGG